MGVTRGRLRGVAAVERRVWVRVRRGPVGRRVGEPEEERLGQRRPAVDEVDRVPGQHVLLEVVRVAAVLDQGAVHVQRVVVDPVSLRGRAPLRPAGRHGRVGPVLVQVLADHPGVIAGVAKPVGQVVVAAELLEAPKAAVRVPVAEHAVVVHVVAGQEGRARGAAEREVDEAVFERHPGVPDQRVDVVHDAHRLERLVVGLDHHDVRPRLGRARLVDARRRRPGGRNRQRADHDRGRRDRYREAPGRRGQTPLHAPSLSPHPSRP